MRKSHSFTLLELLSVIGIIAIVAGIILGGMNYASRRADEAKTISLMTQLEMALDAFKQDRGFYPPASESPVKFLIVSDELILELVLDGASKPYSFVNNTTKRPYIELGWMNDTYKDSWGNAFQYRCPGTNNTSSYDLWSLGAKGLPDDYICNWKRN
jgi:general secretion pathway protein G